MNVKARFKLSKTQLAQIISLMILSIPTTASFAENNLKVVLKNAFIERNYDEDQMKDPGSWSQGISGFYTSDYIPTSLVLNKKPIEIGADASLQYAVRLSDDRHINDTVLPFDDKKKEQDLNFLKYGGTLKFKYDTTEFKVGELWLDLPITAVDSSRQLVSSYWGGQLKSQINPDLKIELGRVTQVSPRYHEGFERFSYTRFGTKHQTDGLNYFDVKYAITPAINAEYYYGNLEDLYDKHYLGLDYTYKNPKFKALTRLKYFNTQESGDALAGNIDNQNFGIMEKVFVGNQTVALGLQKITGNTDYPIPDGFLPELYFINWNTTGFFKKDEQSIHFLYSYDFKNYVPGLNTTFKYVYGDNFKDAKGNENKEWQADFILGYDVQNPMLKGLNFQWIYVKYDIDHGHPFEENRLLTTYTKRF